MAGTGTRQPQEKRCRDGMMEMWDWQKHTHHVTFPIV
jgi:hypothetical protein